MNPHFAETPRPRRRNRFCFALAVVLVLLPGAARAVGGDGIFYSRDAADDGAYFSNQTSFRIPFDPVSPRTQEVALYVSTDFGRKYQKVTTAGPTDKEFRFQSQGDGWYWFAVQSRDADGRSYPPDMSVAQPALKVCVDTRPPTISTFRLLPAQNGQAGVEWEVNDVNLDATTLRVDYRTANGDWMPLPIKQGPTGQYYWNAGANAPVEARLQVLDKAHNPAEQRAAPTGGGFHVGVNPGPTAYPVPPPPATTPDASAAVSMVNTKTLQLDVEIADVGSSKVKAVEIYYTQDGRVWTKYKEDHPPQPPYIVEVPSEGRWGFTLIARSGVGLGLPAPKPGDSPQVWVEVDTTKPDVNIIGVDMGRGPDAGTVIVRWKATDKHLAASPITISYMDAAAGAGGQWLPMTTGAIANDGRYVWHIPDVSGQQALPPQILVRVEAVDQAGNLGVADTANPISTDLSIPKVRVNGVRGAGAVGTGAMPPG